MPHKRFLAIALTLSLTAGAMLPFDVAHAEPKTYQGNVIKTDLRDLPSINPDEIKEIETGATLDMVVSTAITTGVSVSGDEFYGKVSKDYTVDGKVVVPKGTIVHGVVEVIQNPKRAGRNGFIATRFDYMVTPDGREIPIEGGSTTRDGKAKAAAKVVARSTAFTGVGGIVGALMALKYGGLGTAVASHGYSIAGGAAVGGVVGLVTAMVTKGKSAMIEPGTEIRVKLADSLALPTMNIPDPSADNYSLPGLDVKVLGMRFDKDPFGEPNELTMTLEISNKTEYTFSTFEIGLEDEYGNVFFPSPFGDTGMWFNRLTPNSKTVSNVTFSVDNPTQQHKLVFYKQYTREPVAKIALINSMLLDKKAAKKLSKQAIAQPE